MNKSLLAPFSLEETKLAVFSTPLNAATGVDGFSTAFFTSLWDTIKDDILVAMNEMLLTATIPPDLMKTLIMLIPKRSVTETLGDFYPISLCTMIYKIFAKLICNRLAPLLPKLVAPNQGAFIQGRSIFDNISLTQEVCREIGRPGALRTLLYLWICIRPMISWSGTFFLRSLASWASRGNGSG